MTGAHHEAPSPPTEFIEPIDELIDNMLADLDIEDIIGGDQVEETIPADILEAAEQAAQIESAVTECHAEADIDAVSTDMTAAVAVGKKATKRESAKTPKIERDLSALPAEAFVLTTDQIDDIDEGKVTVDEIKKAVISVRPLQVKVAEKFDNLLIAINAGREPSKFTSISIDLLNRNGEVTSAELVACLQAAKYTEGTARAQAGQMFALFPRMQMATRTGNKMIKNPNSTIMSALKRP